MSIYLSGSSGFVGTNLISSFKENFSITKHIRNSEFVISEEIVIHLAGLAHDLNNIKNYDDYYSVNTELTKKIFDSFLKSDAKVFIMMSSVKSVADKMSDILTEVQTPNPQTHYGKSKLLAENYVISKLAAKDKRIYILRPSMIYGNGNKGNINQLYDFISYGFPWILGSFENKRTFCSIKNLLFVIEQLILNENIPSGVYNISDSESISTNTLINLIAKSQNKKIVILNFPKFLIKIFAKMGDYLPLPLNSEKLNKLTESYVVSNKKILEAIKKPMPVKTADGILNTFKYFNKK